MKFGLFGSAQAKRGGSDLDSGQGFRDYIEYNVEAEALGYDSTFVVEHHFTGLRPGVGEPQPADLGRGAHQDAAARHRRDRAALAQSGAAGRAGRDHRSAVRRPARIRRRQGLPPQRVRQLLHPAGGGRRALRGRPRADPQVLDLRGALLAPRQVLALRGHHRRAADPRRSRIRRSGWRRAARTRSARWRGAATSCCSTSSPRPPSVDRALQHLQGRGRGLRPHVRSDGRRRVSAPSSCRATPRKRPRRSRRGSPTSGGWPILSQMRRTATASPALSFADRWMRPARARCSARRTRSRRSSKRCAPAGIEYILLNGPAGSRDNLRSFARDVMPAFTGSRERAAPRLVKR